MRRLTRIQIVLIVILIALVPIGSWRIWSAFHAPSPSVAPLNESQIPQSRATLIPPAPPGRWTRASTSRGRADLTDEQQTKIQELEAMGYLAGVNPASEFVSVTKHDRARAQQGLNFYVSGHGYEAILMDMDGKVLHHWRHDSGADIDFKLSRAFAVALEDSTYWRRGWIYPNGDILAMVEGFALFKLDRDSNLLWGYQGIPHHDLDVIEDGTIYLLDRKADLIPDFNPNHVILEDFVVVLDPNGNELNRVSVHRAFLNSEFMNEGLKLEGDNAHTNAISVLDGNLDDRSAAIRKGNILISARNIDTIAILDMESERIVWSLKGIWKHQHEPELLTTGNILMFDNWGTSGQSGPARVLEIEPVANAVVWSYGGTADEPLRSMYCGVAHRLPDGNTLIVESEGGRALEVTPQKEIVWEFYSPHRTGEETELVATLFDMVRLPKDFPTEWIPANP